VEKVLCLAALMKQHRLIHYMVAKKKVNINVTTSVRNIFASTDFPSGFRSVRFVTVWIHTLDVCHMWGACRHSEVFGSIKKSQCAFELYGNLRLVVFHNISVPNYWFHFTGWQYSFAHGSCQRL
jgi:hypothetical protein